MWLLSFVEKEGELVLSGLFLRSPLHDDTK